VSVSGVEASVWEERVCGSQCSYEERLFTIEELVTGVITRQENTQMSKMGGRKRKKSATLH
jgi:hypothetical protein